MSTYYVLLDNAYTTSGHAGTTVDPLSLEDVNLTLSGVGNYTFKLRGTRDNGNLNPVYKTAAIEAIFENWDVSVYGPWRMKCYWPVDVFMGALDSRSTFRDGILESISGDPIGFGNFYDMVLLGKVSGDSNITYSFPPNIYIENTIIQNTGKVTFDFPTNNRQLIITNSIINCYFEFINGTGSESGTFSNIYALESCATFFNKPATYTNVNFQSMIASGATNLNFNSPVEAFDIDPFGTTGPSWARSYEIDPYGGNRENAGFFYFGTVMNADFSATPRLGRSPLSVQFTNLSQNALTYNWNFGDGNFSTDVNPSHIYSSEGTYTVILSAYNLLNNHVETKLQYIVVTDRGHIGAFYFGPVEEETEFDIIEISAVLLQPTVSTQNNICATEEPFYLPIYFNLLQPTVYAFQDIEVDFIGVLRVGVSPLTVDFTAIVKMSPEIKSKYKVIEYTWCFDYDYTNNVCNIPSVTTTQNPISHVYTGYRGRQYSVKCCVKLGLIN